MTICMAVSVLMFNAVIMVVYMNMWFISNSPANTPECVNQTKSN